MHCRYSVSWQFLADAYKDRRLNQDLKKGEELRVKKKGKKEESEENIRKIKEEK